MKASVRRVRTRPASTSPEPAVRVDELARLRSSDPDGHRVDGEIAAGKIVVQAARADNRQCTGARVVLAPCRDEVDVPVTVRQLQHGRPKALDARRPARRAGGPRRAPAQSHRPRRRGRRSCRCTRPSSASRHDPADDTDLTRSGTAAAAPSTGCARTSSARWVRSIVVSWDPLSEKLIENSPLRNPELVAAFSRYEHLTIAELDVAWDEVNVAFRALGRATRNMPADRSSRPRSTGTASRSTPCASAAPGGSSLPRRRTVVAPARATTSISTRAPSGSAATPIVERAGACAPKTLGVDRVHRRKVGPQVDEEDRRLDDIRDRRARAGRGRPRCSPAPGVSGR